MAVIYCFGDSLTYGAWDIERGGWANRLRNHLDELQLKDPSLYYLCYNLGVPGESSDSLVNRFDPEMRVRDSFNSREEESIFIFAFGANDYVFKEKTGTFAVPADRFVANLETVIEKASKVSRKILLLNIAPCNEAARAAYSLRHGRDQVRLNANAEIYNKALALLAANTGVSLVDVYSEYMKGDFKDLLSEDGLHPNERGHESIFNLVKKALQI